ncbi:hypothetical protein [Clostridium sp. UBA6640]|uniref:hypothetical protein n=1 Tax=Clostridium sp. UBA6640 TaxID=1946370 RepID=UPI0025B9DEBD|nr:hypothetical protein [Clostridium sp. UBA6640]
MQILKGSLVTSLNVFLAVRNNITPYVISGQEGEKKTDYYKVLYDEVFYVEIK